MKKFIATFFTNSIIYPNGDRLVEYNDSFYEKNSKYGFYKPGDFYELPQWINTLSANKNFMSVYSQQYVISISKFDLSKPFSNGLITMYTDSDIYMSVMDSTKEDTLDFIERINCITNCVFYISGYCDFSKFKDIPNVKIYESLDTLFKDTNCVVQEFDIDYSLFYSAIHKQYGITNFIPRFYIQNGCRNNCSFCIVDKHSKIYTNREIDNQIKALDNLNFELVYINDPTFIEGNLNKLTDIYNNIKVNNKQFRGFIIQTTVHELVKNASFYNYMETHPGIIQCVEFGLETYNDKLLSKYNKPSTEKEIFSALGLLELQRVKAIPNIIVGIPGETKKTYNRTIKFLNDNRKWIFSLNIFRYCDYSNPNNYGEVKLDKERLLDLEFEISLIKLGKSLWI